MLVCARTFGPAGGVWSFTPGQAHGPPHPGHAALRPAGRAAGGALYVIGKADGDAVVSESLETNNVKASGVVRIGADLTVTAFTVPVELGAGEPVVVTATTKNSGGGDAPPSATAVYLSVNGTFDASDVLLGSIPVPFLEAGALDTATGTLMVPATTVAGSYRVIAIADGAGDIAETNETNNNRIQRNRPRRPGSDCLGADDGRDERPGRNRDGH